MTVSKVHQQFGAGEHSWIVYQWKDLLQVRELQDARAVFLRNAFSWNIMIATYAYDKIPGRNTVVLVSAYAQNGDLHEAVPEKNVVSWIMMIQAYAQNGHVEKAKSMFDSMIPGSLNDHGYRIRPGWAHCICSQGASASYASLWTCMIAAYGQNGDEAITRGLYRGQRLFERMPQRDVISWNTVITAYAHNGHRNCAVEDVLSDEAGSHPYTMPCRCAWDITRMDHLCMPHGSMRGFMPCMWTAQFIWNRAVTRMHEDIHYAYIVWIFILQPYMRIFILSIFKSMFHV